MTNKSFFIDNKPNEKLKSLRNNAIDKQLNKEYNLNLKYDLLKTRIFR